MGKALGNTLDPAALVGAYGPDAVRLFFMKEVRQHADSGVTLLLVAAHTPCGH